MQFSRFLRWIFHLFLGQCVYVAAKTKIIGNKVVLQYEHSIPIADESVTWIEGRNNFISEITPLSFSHNKFRRIDFKNNRIRSIANDTFTNQTELEILDLSSNKLHSLSDHIFDNNLKLHVLHLYDNLDLNFSLRYLPQSLQVLNLHNTSLVLTMNDLRRLTYLRNYHGYLYISKLIEFNGTFVRSECKNCKKQAINKQSARDSKLSRFDDTLYVIKSHIGRRVDDLNSTGEQVRDTIHQILKAQIPVSWIIGIYVIFSIILFLEIVLLLMILLLP